jgi:hypothetical protein
MKRPQDGQAVDPVTVIEGFLLAHDAGLYPPMWVLNCLATAFRSYYDHQGRKRLDDCLGLNAGQGKNWFREKVLRDLHYWLALQLYRLKVCFKLSLEDAATMLAAKVDEHPVKNTSIWTGIRTTFSAETLIDKYSRSWRKTFGLNETNSNSLAHPDCPRHPWTPEQRRTFLLTFPRHAWPARLQTRA